MFVCVLPFFSATAEPSGLKFGICLQYHVRKSKLFGIKWADHLPKKGTKWAQNGSQNA